MRISLILVVLLVLTSSFVFAGQHQRKEATKDSSSSKSQVYVEKIYSQVSEKWKFFNQEKNYPEKLEAILGMHINKNGEVVSLFFEKKSLNEQFNNEVKEIVESFKKFDPPPANLLNNDVFEIFIKFVTGLNLPQGTGRS